MTRPAAPLFFATAPQRLCRPTWRTPAALACALLLCVPAWADATRPGDMAQRNLPRLQLSAGMHLIDAQVASTPQQRSHGLMHRQSMPQNEGMLFVFEQPGVQCFWMKNTPLPLTAAFIDDSGAITNLADMQPLSEDSHCSSAPVRYVLEMNQGWFAKRGVAPGRVLRGLPLPRR